MEAADSKIKTLRQNHLNLKTAQHLNDMLPKLSTATHKIAHDLNDEERNNHGCHVVCVQAVGEADAQLRNLGADIIISTDRDLLLFRSRPFSYQLPTAVTVDNGGGAVVTFSSPPHPNPPSQPVLQVMDSSFVHKSTVPTFSPPPPDAKYNDHLTIGQVQLLYAALLDSDYPEHHIKGIGFQIVSKLLGRRRGGRRGGLLRHIHHLITYTIFQQRALAKATPSGTAFSSPLRGCWWPTM